MPKALPHNYSGKSFLPEDYEPSPIDVICARGIKSFHHCGNTSFRKAIADNLEMYGASSTKRDKSMIVSSIANEFYFNDDERCRFIRFCDSRSLWYEISYDQVRQKVGQTMRDTLLQQDPQRLSKKKHWRACRASTRYYDSSNTNRRISRSSVITTTTHPEEHLLHSQLGSGTVSTIPLESLVCLPSILPTGHPFSETFPPLSIQGSPPAQYAQQNFATIPVQEQLCGELSWTNLEYLEWATLDHKVAHKAANGSYELVDSCRLDELDSSDTTRASRLSHGHLFCETVPPMFTAQHTIQQDVSIPAQEQFCSELTWPTLEYLEWTTSVQNKVAFEAANRSSSLVVDSCNRIDESDSESKSESSCQWFAESDELRLSNCDWLEDDDDAKLWK